MKLVYEASNTVEAHMILNMLESSGFKGRVDGEFLQGGVGELQAIGLVRVMIEGSDYDKARRAIKEWEANQPEKTVEKNQKEAQTGAGFFLVGLALGAVLGALAMFIFDQFPA